VSRSPKRARPCGCKSGAAFMLAALVAWPVWVAARGLPDGVVGIATAIATYVGVVILSATVGKLGGILVGTIRGGH
jgi:hypothetical protein